MTLLAAAFAAAPCHAQEQDKPVMSAVVQVDGEYRVIPKETVDDLKAESAKKHKEAVAEHKKAAATAKKAKEKFTMPAPKASKMKIIKPSIEASLAEKFVAELRAKDETQKEPAKKEPAKKEPAKRDPAKKVPPKKTGK